MRAKLNTSAIQQGEFARMLWVATPEEGVTVDMLLRPDYWSFVAHQLRPWNRIEVRDAGFGWVAELIVLDSGHNWAKVEIVSFYDFEKRSQAQEIAEPETDEFEIKWRGRAGWSIKRIADGEIMADAAAGIASKADAVIWLQRHLAKIAA